MKILSTVQSIVVPKVFMAGSGPIAGETLPAYITIGSSGYMSGYLKDEYGIWHDPYIDGHEVLNHLSNYTTDIVRLVFAEGKIEGVDSVRAVMDETYEVTIPWSETDGEYRTTNTAYADHLRDMRGKTVGFFFELL